MAKATKKPAVQVQPVYVDQVMIQVVFKRPRPDGTLEALHSTGPVEYSREGFAKAFDEAEGNRQKIAEGRENEK